MKPKTLILHVTGTNRDNDVAEAITLAGGTPHILHINQLRAEKIKWSDFQMLVLPGGFSYADALGAGKLWAIDLNTYFENEMQEFIDKGKPVIGICNGFQSLIKAGVFDPKTSADGNANATLTFNGSGKFECRWVTLKTNSTKCVWTNNLTELIDCPVAHGEGNFQLSDPSDKDWLINNDQVALIYVLPNGNPANGGYPYNPNGSLMDIAGICNPMGNVLGMMPHPENHIYNHQHPQSSRKFTGRTGLTLFANGINYAKQL